MKEPAYQCKIFEECSCIFLEKQVNEWFLENPNVHIVNVLHSCSNYGHAIFILYEPMKEVK